MRTPARRLKRASRGSCRWPRKPTRFWRLKTSPPPWAARSLWPISPDASTTPRLKICIDTGHALITEGKNAQSAIERLAPLCVATHLHDNDGRSDTHLIPGEGAFGWTSFFTTLDTQGYRGPLTLELRRKDEHYAKTLAAAARAIKALVSENKTESRMKANLTEQTRAHERLKTLALDHFGVSVSSLAPLRGDASTRDYVRLTHPGGARPSSVGMIMPEPFTKETLPFIDVQRHFTEIGVRAPEIFGVDEEACVILLEDCGDESLEDVWRSGGWEEARPHYTAAMEMMAAMQRCSDRSHKRPARAHAQL